MNTNCRAQARHFWNTQLTPGHSQSYQCKKAGTTWAEYSIEGFLRREGEARTYLQPTCELHAKDKAKSRRTITSRAELEANLRFGTAKEGAK